MISEIIVRNWIKRSIFENYQTNYFIEFGLYVDVELILFVLCEDFFFFFKVDVRR